MLFLSEKNAPICAIEIEEDALVLTKLRTAEEVRTLGEIGHPDLPKSDAQMLDIAEKIVAQQSGDFDPSECRYEEALRDLTEEKKTGKPLKSTKPREADDTNVIDRMAALKKSLQGEGSVERRKSSAARTKKAANNNRRKGRAA